MEEKRIFGEIKFLAGANNFNALPSHGLLEIAVWGRSNVGKSSTINSIFNNNTVARVSQTPGRTQQINLFTIGDNSAVIADLPGYGYAKVSKTIAANLFELCYDYLHSRRISLIFLLIDARRGITLVDQEIIDALKALKHQFCLLITKTDLEKNINLEEFKNFDHLLLSNKSKAGIIDIRKKIIRIINESTNKNRKSQ